MGLSGLVAQDLSAPAPDGIRKGGTLAENLPAPLIADPVEADGRRLRAYPEQPPTIPHKIRGYQTDKNANRCLGCHSRIQTAKSGAPMISITHFMDRDFQMLATVSPRRYFCLQCHVPQSDAPLEVENTFEDVDTLLDTEKREGSGQ